MNISRAVLRLTTTLLVALSVTVHAQSANFAAAVEIHHARGADSRDNSNVVVWLTPLTPNAKQDVRTDRRYTITQRNKHFVPHVLAVPVGTKIQFPNKDPFFHNVFSLYQGKRFDLGLYEAGSSREVLFDRPGVSFIFCNIHPNMSGYVLALETGWFDTSTKNGKIEISDVPSGRYRLQVWYERAESADLEKLSRIVEIDHADLNLGTIEVPESARLQSHSNKHGKPYDPEQTPY